jgi:hypothetical protein
MRLIPIIKLMKKNVLTGLCFSLACLASGCAFAQNVAPGNVAKPNQSTPVTTDNLDNDAYAEWDNGHETAIAGDGADKTRQPGWVIWNGKNPVYHTGFWFGDSKTPGVRHLRIGFKTSVAVGSVLARGGGSLTMV